MTESGTRLYSDSEIDLLIDEISGAAYEAIEQAAAEAAKAATLASLERETQATREAKHWRQEAEHVKQNGLKNMIMCGLISFLGGFVVGLVVNNK